MTQSVDSNQRTNKGQIPQRTEVSKSNNHGMEHSKQSLIIARFSNSVPINKICSELDMSMRSVTPLIPKELRRSRLEELIKQGLKRKEIYTKLGISLSTLKRWLSEFQLNLLKTSVSRENRVSQAKKLLKNGMTKKQVCEELGISRSTLGRLLNPKIKSLPKRKIKSPKNAKKEFKIQNKVTEKQISLKLDKEQIYKKFDNLICMFNLAGQTEFRNFSELLENSIDIHQTHPTLKEVPKLMLEIYRRGKFIITENDVQKFQTESSEKKREILFALHLLMDLKTAPISKKTGIKNAIILASIRRDFPKNPKTCLPVYSMQNRLSYLIKEFDPNNRKPIYEYTYGSSQPVKWTCTKCSKKWIAPPCNRTRKNNPSGCPSCSIKRRNKQLSLPTDENRLVDHATHLMDEYDFINNPPPHKLATRSHIILRWICKKCKKPFKAPIANRTDRENPTDCPKCAGNVVTEKNRLTIHARQILDEYDPDNLEPPYNMAVQSPKKCKWICRNCKHKWEASPADRTRTDNPTGCPKCAKMRDIHNDLSYRWEFFGEKLIKLLYENITYQFHINTKNGYIRPDVVIFLDDTPIKRGKTKHFHILLDFKLNPIGKNVTKTIDNYSDFCDRLVIVHLFGHRMDIKPEDNNGTPVDFINFPDLLGEIKKRINNKKLNKSILTDLVEEYEEIRKFAYQYRSNLTIESKQNTQINY
ncbi:MAG: zinc-ribbon domain-containing protein [Promethearchaeota archaeon]